MKSILPIPVRRGLAMAAALCAAWPCSRAAAIDAADVPAVPPPRSAGLGYREALVLGLVEGITEYLPISSTGHLLLTNALFGLDSEAPLLGPDGEPLLTPRGEPVTIKAAADAYAIVIQGGAILAVLFLYWGRVWQVALGLLGLSPHGLLLGRNLLLAFLPAVVLGLLLGDWIEAALFAPLPIAIALAAGGVLMLGVEAWRGRRPPAGSDHPDLHALSVRQALFIGLLQCVAMWPGISRSMMTIVGGYLVGLRPAKAAEFSFLLGLITLSAAAGYTALRSGPAMRVALDTGPMLLGVAVAFGAAALAVKWLVGHLARHGLALFAWYRLALAALVVAWFVR